MFHFTDALSRLIADITLRVPALSHVRPERTLVFARRGRSGADGPNATCHCLTLPTSEPGYYFWADATTGKLTRRTPWFVTRSPELVVNGTAVDYMISFALPRFSDQVSRRKLERYAGTGLPSWVVRLDTVVHELYHIAPDAAGLRQLTRADGSLDQRAHPPQFFDDVRALVIDYLATQPSDEMLEVVRHDFATLQQRHAGVIGTTFRDGSYPQRYVHALEQQPADPDVLVVPFKDAPGRGHFTEADLVVRNFSRAQPPVVPVRAA
ncbi:MAG TPA: hypothetical protein VMF13_05605 [Luteitalea sp.]|nr:hypothetical protein [Luteitalea sp.]